MSLDTSARPPHSTAVPARLDQAAAVRASLEQHRQARQDQIAAHTFADPDSSDLDPQARMRALATAKLILVEIEKALSRLDDGSYGFCLGCTDPIPEERLLAVPYSRHCVPCA